MKYHFYLLLIISIFKTENTYSQFGPKKKVLQSQIDSLEMLVNSHKSEINNMRFRDSLSFSEIKRLAGEMKDIKQNLIELNDEIFKLKNQNQSLIEENQNLKLKYDQLIEKVENQQNLIEEVIGGDSTETEMTEEEETDNTNNDNLNNFNEFAIDFLKKLKKDGELSLSKFTIDTLGFYYMSKPGFITSVSKITDVNELTEEIPWKIALDMLKKSKYSFLEGEKPIVNCDMANLYNKRGCYGGLEENFSKISKSLTDLKEFSPDEEISLIKDIEEIKEIEKEITVFIYSTDGNLGFYFIKQNNTWKLVCIDVDDPCST